MLTWLPKPLVGFIAISLYAVNLLIWFTYLFISACFKWLIPIAKWQAFWQHNMHLTSRFWVVGNNLIMRLTTKTQFDIQGLEQLDPKTWYLLLANHQTWTDILVLFKALETKAPPARFFLKEELRWLPLVGQACWLLDFPFMKRHSSTAIARHPELRLQDLNTTRKACEKFKKIPITLINFVEGTRFRTAKHHKQKSPYTYLLKPKAGGLAFALAAMDGQIKQILDVTILYAPHRANFWDFCCGKVNKISVVLNLLAVTAEWNGDYLDDKEFRQRFQLQINQLWQQKDELIHHWLNQNQNDKI